MKPVSFLRALSVAACVLSAVPALAAQAPPAAGITEARSAIRDGRFEDALGILRPLAGAARGNARFLLGMAAVGAAEAPGIDEDSRDALLDEAITAFRAMLVADPGLVRVRLELARAFFLKDEDRLATRHFEQVLAGKPPAAVALNVNRFLSIMRARKRWSVRVGMAVAPDTNLSARSEGEIILIDTPFGRLPFTYQGDKAKSGIGVSLWAGGEYQYPLSPRWRLRAGGDIHRREYRGSRFDRMNAGLHVGPRWLIGRASEMSLLASARQAWAADEKDYRDLGIRTEALHRLNRRTTAHLGLSRHERRYEDRDHLDGPITDLSLGIGWVATPTMRIDTALGWGKQRPENKRDRHTHRWGRLGVTLALPWGFNVGGAGTLRWTAFEGGWTPFVLDGGPRKDLTRSLRLTVHNRAFTIGGFSPQLFVTREDRTSNAQLHDYEKTAGELRFVRLF